MCSDWPILGWTLVFIFECCRDVQIIIDYYNFFTLVYLATIMWDLFRKLNLLGLQRSLKLTGDFLLSLCCC